MRLRRRAPSRGAQHSKRLPAEGHRGDLREPQLEPAQVAVPYRDGPAHSQLLCCARRRTGTREHCQWVKQRGTAATGMVAGSTCPVVWQWSLVVVRMGATATPLRWD